MRIPLGRQAGLIGQVFAILLLAMVLEFGVSTLLYERAGRFSIRDDEARRLAEHLAVARKVLSDEPPAGRPAMARELTTSRYEVRWLPQMQASLSLAPSLDRVYRQVIAWEPELADSDLRLKLVSPGRDAVTAGMLRLRDGTWLVFRTRDAIHQPDLAIKRILLTMIPAAALILLGGLALRRTLLPLRRLAVAADGIAIDGDTDGTVPEIGPSEVRRVIVAFNRMHARIYALIADRTQALAAVGHDLRTPLARLRLRADAIADADLRSAIDADVREMDAMVASLLTYLDNDGEIEAYAVIDLAVLLATLRDQMTDDGRSAAYGGPEHLEMPLRPVTIKRAIANLVENALRYGTCVSLSLARDGDRVTIRVEDDGPGIPEDSLERAREPFVRLDPARARDTVGLGLGLAIVARAVADHGGVLTLSNRAQRGLRAEITLPRDPGNLL